MLIDDEPTPSTASPPPVFLVSGGVGSSGQQLVNTVLAQFTGPEVPVVVVPHVRSAAEIQQAVERAASAGGVIVHTLVNADLRRVLTDLAQDRGVVAIDLMGDLLDCLAAVLGQQPVGKPGLYRQRREAYFERVAAIEFAVSHDDGMRIEDLPKADIVLVGVSRSGKTPLSMYLSVMGWKVANVPFILSLSLPPELSQVDRRRVVGLVVEPGQLLAHRRWRQQSLGIPKNSSYTNGEDVYEEAEAAHRFFRRQGFGTVNTTDKPVETSAEEVIDLVTRRLRMPAGDT
jgi:[pyruvate, water dikinase]-phosphate phosphotransferase / [pyruvate, water dikinase] kinase